jgi:hypothetical protein
MYLFNSGVLVCTPNAGNLSAFPTPLALGVLQEGSIDVSFEVKELYGQAQFPVDVATGKGKVTGKAKFASITGKTLTDIIFGQTTAVGYNSPVYNEGPTAIPATPFTITVSNATNYIADLGVINAATGVPFTCISTVGGGTPTAGQYSVSLSGANKGKYIFSSADNVSGISVKISYIYSVAASGISITLANQLMGYGPIFEADLFIQYEAQVALTRWFACRMTKWSFPAKQGDYLIQDVEFSMFANAAGNLAELDFSQ